MLFFACVIMQQPGWRRFIEKRLDYERPLRVLVITGKSVTKKFIEEIGHWQGRSIGKIPSKVTVLPIY